VQIVLYVFPFLLLLRTKRGRGENRTERYRNLDYQDGIQDLPSLAQTNGKATETMHDFEYLQALKSVEFWCLFFTFFGGTGAAYMTINQLTQVSICIRLTVSKNPAMSS